MVIFISYNLSLGGVSLSKKAFHIYNIIVLVFLLSFNILALFGGAMSQGGVEISMWFMVLLSFVFWIIFYQVQYVRNDRIWRISWFLIMTMFLFVWETGFGTYLGGFLFG